MKNLWIDLLTLKLLSTDLKLLKHLSLVAILKVVVVQPARMQSNFMHSRHSTRAVKRVTAAVVRCESLAALATLA